MDTEAEHQRRRWPNIRAREWKFNHKNLECISPWYIQGVVNSNRS